MPDKLFCRLLLISGLIAFLNACTGIGPATTLFRSTSPHEQYGQSLKDAKLAKTALGTDWLAASERALRDSLRITVPYRESGYFTAEKAFAVGYRLSAQRGDKLMINVETLGNREAQVFIDVFSLDERGRTSLLASSKADTNVLAWEPRRTQTYLIRVQPELLRSGQFTISVTREPALSFPVKGRDSRQISSVFGVARDGGRRRHEGVDIFAPRGTPAVASVNGIISSVGTNRLGGNVVFLSDNERNIRLYYAHLDRWNVTNGQRVAIGDTVGFVGNTGNARTTGPHLHFGIYEFGGGATDPLPFIRLGRGPARQGLLAENRLGTSARVSANRSVVRIAPGSNAAVIRELPRAAALQIIGGTNAWPRVELPDGLTGYVATATLESATRPLRQQTLTTTRNLLDEANPTAATKATLPVGATVDVLGGFGLFELIRKADGTTGWLAKQTAP
ncbi:peptidoglycan DD-metalloendopeptidase family protein [Spirosoma sp. KUDC1026]|uniref:peptidoglycan DD-metalloendopeptidase family protein n=1 Tax=Spirosoma sp. KUDC1026 TaxID=2745947 RepID=UPI00159B9725|nr:peptidoglycan DD-metalloendopeptidase family protein [Spirosoma sp. KUDC1026]QKZ12771.1 peptidoglycan DD-metalloendopeptidase family protein [Spirosoma sp. KUDC1026]